MFYPPIRYVTQYISLLNILMSANGQTLCELQKHISWPYMLCTYSYTSMSTPKLGPSQKLEVKGKMNGPKQNTHYLPPPHNNHPPTGHNLTLFPNEPPCNTPQLSSNIAVPGNQ